MKSCENSIASIKSLMGYIDRNMSNIRGKGRWVDATRSIILRVYRVLEDASSLLKDFNCIIENSGKCFTYSDRRLCKGCGSLMQMATPTICSIYRIGDMRGIRFDTENDTLMLMTSKTLITINRNGLKGQIRALKIESNYLNVEDTSMKYHDVLLLLKNAEHLMSLLRHAVTKCIKDRNIVCS